MEDGACHAGDIVTSPALVEGSAVVDECGAAENQQRPAIGCGEHAPDHHAGDAQTLVGEMASEAILLPLKLRAMAGLLGERIEEDACFCILRRQFDEAAEHPGYQYRVIKKDGAGITRLNAVPLEAGFGKNRDLGRDRNIKASSKDRRYP
jgi:hypothetical protein